LTRLFKYESARIISAWASWSLAIFPKAASIAVGEFASKACNVSFMLCAASCTSLYFTLKACGLCVLTNIGGAGRGRRRVKPLRRCGFASSRFDGLAARFGAPLHCLPQVSTRHCSGSNSFTGSRQFGISTKLAGHLPMSALGQKRTSEYARPMSALPPKADMVQHDRDVRFVPKADIGPMKQRICVLGRCRATQPGPNRLGSVTTAASGTPIHSP